VVGGPGVTASTKQEKKRKRPDDKKQGISKKMGGRQPQYSNNQGAVSENPQIRGERRSAAEASSGPGQQAILPKTAAKTAKSHYD
jgi:hypothetical protein